MPDTLAEIPAPFESPLPVVRPASSRGCRQLIYGLPAVAVAVSASVAVVVQPWLAAKPATASKKTAKGRHAATKPAHDARPELLVPLRSGKIITTSFLLDILSPSPNDGGRSSIG
jgi:hypothetical protein